MRSIDWSKTRIGPVERWPLSLRTMVGVLLGNRFPMLLWWGPDLVQLYNDSYRPVLGDKHPGSMGALGPDVWKEIWGVIGPMAEGVLAGSEATWSENLLLEMNRSGFLEETYFTFSYSPVPDDDGSVGGVLVTCKETTGQVFSERQLKMLRDLGARAADSRSAEEACRAAAETLATNDADIPYALLYLTNDPNQSAELVATVGLDSFPDLAGPGLISLRKEESVDGHWPLAAALQSADEIVIEDVRRSQGEMPGGRWPSPSTRAVVVALPGATPALPVGFLVAGLSARRALDARYRGLFRLAADQIATAIRNGRAQEDEHRRLEALAEIDRAKTAFFANISHEFRTPLTLLLGPIENALALPRPELSGPDLESVHRSALRLLKLVNALLEFSRIEANRVQPHFEAGDLAAMTANVAGVFRSAIEQAGLTFTVSCEPMGAPAHVDRGMWETIVLNLLSNALKFTREGEIEVDLREVGGNAVLTVRDTGVGISAKNLPRVFERFHRIAGGWSRTHEGSGIGLALVRELARIHGGEVAVTSEGRGSTFSVCIPLEQERVSLEASNGANTRAMTSFVEEARGWRPDSTVLPRGGDGDQVASGCLSRILVVDDNADMREYLARLLETRYLIHAAPGGRPALELVKHNPVDLVLSDVMMPDMDGFELLSALRSDPATRRVPVILLSARAGEESRVEGLEAGADDYLVKPFSAKELLARVATHLELSRLRRAEESARAEAESANRAKDEFLAMLGHELRNPLSPIMTSLEIMRLRGIHSHEQDVLERQVSNLTRLVDDLLDISRITGGKVILRKEVVEIHEVVGRALEVTSPLLEGRRHQVHIDVPRQGLPVHVDPDRMAQVVSNLLTNAAKYSEPGSAIRLEAVRQNDRVRIRVEDEGMGISGEMIGRVFDLFVQQPQSLERSRGGLGIGLTIVRSLVEMHGGSVSVRSEGPGRGSEFLVELPAAEDLVPGVAPKQETALSKRPGTGRKRILVVDDNDDAAFSLREALESLGYAVEIAGSGPSALRKLEVFWPDIALVDIGLPVMDGYEFAERLGVMKPERRTPRLMALTGYGQEADQERSAAAGFECHILKPVDLARLHDLIEKIDVEVRTAPR